jgi:hypothetical protein
MASGFGKRAGLPGWAGLVCGLPLLMHLSLLLACYPPWRRWSLHFFLRFGDRFAFSRGDPEQKLRSHMMSFHKSLPLSFSSAHSFWP